MERRGGGSRGGGVKESIGKSGDKRTQNTVTYRFPIESAVETETFLSATTLETKPDAQYPKARRDEPDNPRREYAQSRMKGMQ